MLNHPYFYEEQMRLHNWQLQKFDRHAWKWTHVQRKHAVNLLTLLLVAIGLKSV